MVCVALTPETYLIDMFGGNPIERKCIIKFIIFINVEFCKTLRRVTSTYCPFVNCSSVKSLLTKNFNIFRLTVDVIQHMKNTTNFKTKFPVNVCQNFVVNVGKSILVPRMTNMTKVKFNSEKFKLKRNNNSRRNIVQ